MNYRESDSILTVRELNSRIFSVTVFYAVIGLTFGGAISSALAIILFGSNQVFLWGVVGAAVGVGIGTENGRSKVLQYRWQRDVLLSLIQTVRGIDEIADILSQEADFELEDGE